MNTGFTSVPKIYRTENISMHDYREKLIDCGVTVANPVLFYRIGRSVYSALYYINANGDWSLALKPVYRTDWVTATDAGPYPSLLPAQYKRASKRAIWLTPSGEAFMLVGYSDAEQVLWLHPADLSIHGNRFIQMHRA